jgi:hypothetical protein
MKTNIFKQNFLMASILIFSASCSDEQQADIMEESPIEEEIVDAETIKKNAFLKDVTLLLGGALQNSKVQDEMLENMQNVDMYDQLVTLSFMLGDERMISKSEKSYLSKKGASAAKSISLFRDAIKNELSGGSESYKGIYDKYDVLPISSKSSSTAKEQTANELLELLANEELHLYYPYEELGKTSKTARPQEMLLTYSPEGYTESNEVFRVTSSPASNNRPQLQSVGVQNDDYLYGNSVLVLGYMDDCDISGRPCDFEEIYPTFAQNPNLPPPFTGGPLLLTYNVNPADIKEEDNLGTRMMQFGTKKSGWGGFGRTHLKLEVVRGSLDGNPTVVDGKVVSGPRVFPFFKTKYRMKGDKEGWWHNYSALFDEDWNMTEAEQMIAIFTNHRISFSAETDLTVKIGAEVKGGKIVPKVEATRSYTIKAKVGSAKDRLKISVSRRLALAANVGANDQYPKTRFLNGIAWNVKGPDDEKFFYIFNHYYTKLH